jgi:hypothetical protein
MKRFTKALGVIAVGCAAASCGKSVNLGVDSVIAAYCADADRLSWRFVQPDPAVATAVDLLFVARTSCSDTAEQRAVAAAVPAFIAGLPAGTDYRIGVMPANGGASSWSGRLFSSGLLPRVFESGQLGPATIQSGLTTVLNSLPRDADDAGGRAGFYSFLRGLKADRLAESRALGFFRDEAALAVVFVSNTDDLCSDSGAPASYCAGITPAAVAAALAATKPGNRFSAGAIVHFDPSLVPRNGEDSIGHGYLALLTDLASQGERTEAIELGNYDYSPGLRALVDFPTSSLDLMTSFPLGSATLILPSSLSVLVDGAPVAASFDSSSNVVSVAASAAGHAESVVTISACGI